MECKRELKGSSSLRKLRRTLVASSIILIGTYLLGHDRNLAPTPGAVIELLSCLPVDCEIWRIREDSLGNLEKSGSAYGIRVS